MNIRICFLITALSLLINASAQDSTELNLENIYGGKLDAKSFGPVDWLNDHCFTTIEKKGNSNEIVGYETSTGEKTVIVPAERLIPPGASRPLTMNGYTWGRSGTRLLIYTNEKKEIADGSSGDYWVLDLSIWTWYKLGKDLPVQSLKHAQFSPSGDKVAYISGNNLYVEDLSDFEQTQLTFDGGEKIYNGRMQDCNNSMLNLRYDPLLRGRDGFAWSPDGKQIAFVRMDYSHVPYYYMINNTETLYPRVIRFPYIKVGQQLPGFKVGIVAGSGGRINWLQFPGETYDHYLWQMEWTPDPGKIALQVLDRKQQVMQMMVAQADSNLVRVIHTEKDSAWIEPNNIYWIDKGKKFILTSERDGWSHLYAYRADGTLLGLLTPGNFDVIVVQGVDEKNGWIYYIASPDDPSQRYLYRTALDGKGKAERISPASMPGTHLYDASPGMNWSVHEFSTMDQPPVYDLVHLPDHKQVKVLESNDALKEKLKAFRFAATSFFRVNIGNGVLLDAYGIEPDKLDPTKKYPLLFFVYGEPALQTVLDKWVGRQYLWHHMLARQGYVIMSVDNRGTPAPRGREWRKAIYRKLGILAPEDQAAAARAIMREKKYIDSSRIGVYGHSGGGQMSLHLIFRFPDIYSLAMPSSFVSNQRYYHAGYQERFMGLIEDNPDGYRDGSPITWAKGLKGKLLIIHGTGDDNVHYQSFEALVNELVADKKRFSMMSYPNRSHPLQEGRNTQFHLFDLRTSFLNSNMPPGPR
jgi:dipeptidyl-peptidase-4